MSHVFKTSRRDCNRSRNRSLAVHTTRMLHDRRRPASSADLAGALRCVNQAVRIARRMAKREPHIFGPQASGYLRETIEMAGQQDEFRRLLQRVYGDQATPIPSTVWSQRYPEFAGKVDKLVKKW